ncbi:MULTISPECIES: general stress protein [unclassified Schaalia]|uniref:general stress protein n=1 Tax=unclassified Schaalia TaxID=2691889 RepID=UPI001E608B1B|nr:MULTISPECIES: general stress protein [unclassified Schaalia]MCD4549079.1 hypothetical protein [Schaalia sp. lx-260]MCD4557267.1 hypothetical protein [Schaalia sp. lx-100]
MIQRTGEMMSGPHLPDGVEVASYKTYAEAQAAVDYLSDTQFDIKNITIVGTDLFMVERVTGRRTMATVALSGAMTGFLWGGCIGFITFFGNQQATMPWMLLSFALGGGALLGMVMSTLSYALSGGKRDFTSRSQVVAARYAVLASAEVDKAFQLLQNTRGNQMRPAPRRSRRAELSGPTEYGSRPDEQPRFGVRLDGNEMNDQQTASSKATEISDTHEV